MLFGLREFIFLLVLLGIPIGAWQLVFKQNNAHMQEMKNHIREQDGRLVELKKVTAQQPDLNKEIDKLEDAVKIFETKLPAKKEVDVVLDQITRLAHDDEMYVTSVRFETKPIQGDGYNKQPVQIVMDGHFDRFYNFLIGMENLSRMTRITNVRLSRLGKSKDGRISVDLKLHVFYEKDE